VRRIWRVLVTGARDHPDRAWVWSMLDGLIIVYGPGRVVMVHGDHKTGVDVFTRMWATSRGVTQEPHPAAWGLFGRAAGPRRNGQMVAAGADLCLALPTTGSRGTWDCVHKACAAGIPTVVHTRDQGTGWLHYLLICPTGLSVELLRLPDATGMTALMWSTTPPGLPKDQWVLPDGLDTSPARVWSYLHSVAAGTCDQPQVRALRDRHPDLFTPHPFGVTLS
jgi:SLOG family YspA-like protein